MAEGLVRLQLVVGSLHCELAGSVVRNRVELALPQVLKLVQQICSSFGVNKVWRANARVGRVCADILPESNIDHILNREPIISL